MLCILAAVLVCTSSIQAQKNMAGGRKAPMNRSQRSAAVTWRHLRYVFSSCFKLIYVKIVYSKIYLFQSFYHMFRYFPYLLVLFQKRGVPTPLRPRLRQHRQRRIACHARRPWSGCRKPSTSCGRRSKAKVLGASWDRGSPWYQHGTTALLWAIYGGHHGNIHGIYMDHDGT